MCPSLALKAALFAEKNRATFTLDIKLLVLQDESQITKYKASF